MQPIQRRLNCELHVGSYQRRYDMNGRVQTGFCRKRLMQTGSSETLVGWKSGQTIYVPIWDRVRMEGAWLGLGL
jgi:hypothetical protein